MTQQLFYCPNCKQNVSAKSKLGSGCTSGIMFLCAAMTLIVFGLNPLTFIVAGAFGLAMIIIFFVAIFEKTVYVCPICKATNVQRVEESKP